MLKGQYRWIAGRCVP